jgi:hypothetical protein
MPHELFGHWHNDMSPVFWTRDLSFNWLGSEGRHMGQQRIVVYVYGGVINRAEAWLRLSSASSSSSTAESAAGTLNSSTSHVAMSFESPDPVISRSFSVAAAQAAGAFDLFMCCDRDVLQALPPHKAMFMSCGWAEGSPPVHEWGFSAADKTSLVSMQVTVDNFHGNIALLSYFAQQASTSNITSGHRVRLQATDLLKDRVNRFGRGYFMYNSPADYLKVTPATIFSSYGTLSSLAPLTPCSSGLLLFCRHRERQSGLLLQRQAHQLLRSRRGSHLLGRTVHR